MSKQFICFGHRGAAAYAPENTLASVRKALELGADWVEIDVYETHGRLIVLHDERLERTTNGRGFYWQYSLDELRGLDAGKGEKIPFLEEVLDCLRGRAGLNIEIKKTGCAAPLAKIIEREISAKRWRYEHLIVSSFVYSELEEMRRLNAEIALGVLADRLSQAELDFAKRIDAVSLNLNFESLDRPSVEAPKAAGFEVYVFTVDNAEDVEAVIDMGADGCFSNFPDRVVAAAKRLGRYQP